MNIVRYLPSVQFTVIVASIALSGGLVVAAQKITQPSNNTSSLTSTTPTQTVLQTDWLSTLRTIEGANIGATTSLATAETAKTLLSGAVSTNVTDTVARTLLVSLSEAKSQGLGSDIPTQDKLIAQAVSQIKKDRGQPTYTESDLVTSANTTAAIKAYGNAVIAVVSAHPRASYPDVVLAVGKATDNADPSQLAVLTAIQKDYQALAQELSKVPVPSKLRPLHLQAVNNLALMGTSLSDVKVIFEDPLRGLAGFDLYQGLNSETSRVFTNIAQQFAQDGILFSKDEPGNDWSSFISL